MFEKIKKNGKKLALIGSGTVAGLTTALPAFALGTADTTVTTALTTTADNATATLQSIAPIALGVFGVIFVWRLGMRVFRMLAR